jgi:hypothetical protein
VGAEALREEVRVVCSFDTWEMKAMSILSKIVVAAWATSAVLCIPAAGAGDESMTCEQIATELAPYVQQMQPNIQALAQSQQQLYAQGRQKYEERKKEHEALASMATIGALDPTGVSKRAYQAAVIAQAAKDRREDEAQINSPLAKQAKAQSEQVVAQGQQMQNDARLRTLMQLAHQKGCDKK